MDYIYYSCFIKCLVSLLKRPADVPPLSVSSASPPNAASSWYRRNSQVTVLACSLLFWAYRPMLEWQVSLIQVCIYFVFDLVHNSHCYFYMQLFIEDSFEDRIWVDNDSVKDFVANIMTAFPPSRASPSPITPSVGSTVKSYVPNILFSRDLILIVLLFPQGTNWY
jgi:hypothetical protein